VAQLGDPHRKRALVRHRRDELGDSGGRPRHRRRCRSWPDCALPLFRVQAALPAVMVLARGARLRGSSRPPVLLRSVALRTRSFGSFEVFSPSIAIESAPSPTAVAAAAAFEAAGIGPADVDLAQVQDRGSRRTATTSTVHSVPSSISRAPADSFTSPAITRPPGRQARPWSARSAAQPGRCRAGGARAGAARAPAPPPGTTSPSASRNRCSSRLSNP